MKRKPGGGRKKSKPEYSAAENLKEQMEKAVDLYAADCSLQSIAEETGLNPIKVRAYGGVRQFGGVRHQKIFINFLKKF